jgi:hypothetical protein
VRGRPTTSAISLAFNSWKWRSTTASRSSAGSDSIAATTRVRSSACRSAPAGPAARSDAGGTSASGSDRVGGARRNVRARSRQAFTTMR